MQRFEYRMMLAVWQRIRSPLKRPARLFANLKKVINNGTFKKLVPKN